VALDAGNGPLRSGIKQSTNKVKLESQDVKNHLVSHFGPPSPTDIEDDAC